MIWNDIISLNAIGNERKCQLHGIGCNWWSSSIGGAIDLEWHYLFQFNWESKETMFSITWNRIWIRIKNMNKKIIDNMFKLFDSFLLNGIQFVWKRTTDVKWYSSTFLFGLQIENLSGIHSIWIQLGIKGDISMNWFPILGIIDKLFKLKSIGNQKKHRYGTQFNLKSNLCGMIFTNSFIGNLINWFVFKNMNMNDW